MVSSPWRGSSHCTTLHGRRWIIWTAVNYRLHIYTNNINSLPAFSIVLYLVHFNTTHVVNGDIYHVCIQRTKKWVERIEYVGFFLSNCYYFSCQHNPIMTSHVWTTKNMSLVNIYIYTIYRTCFLKDKLVFGIIHPIEINSDYTKQKEEE